MRNDIQFSGKKEITKSEKKEGCEYGRNESPFQKEWTFIYLHILAGKSLKK